MSRDGAKSSFGEVFIACHKEPEVAASRYLPEQPDRGRRTTRRPVRGEPLGWLFRTAVAGDEASWAPLVRHMAPVLHSIARSYRLSEAEADDAVQRTWVRLLTGAHAIKNPDAIAGWLVTCTRREALRSRRCHVAEILTDDPFGAEPTAGDCVEREVLERESRRELLAAINRLSGRQRSLLLHMVQAPGVSYAETAKVLEMPVGAIGPTRERGLDRLRNDPRVASLAIAC
jgi:RNA polymerase sigma factor (sigma-70 family)